MNHSRTINDVRADMRLCISLQATVAEIGKHGLERHYRAFEEELRMMECEVAVLEEMYS